MLQYNMNTISGGGAIQQGGAMVPLFLLSYATPQLQIVALNCPYNDKKLKQNCFETVFLF